MSNQDWLSEILDEFNKKALAIKANYKTNEVGMLDMNWEVPNTQKLIAEAKAAILSKLDEAIPKKKSHVEKPNIRKLDSSDFKYLDGFNAAIEQIREALLK